MVTPRINSQHDGRCDNPVAPRKKATDPCINLSGSLTLLCQLAKRADFMSPHHTRSDSPVETPEEPRDPCRLWRGTLTFRPQLQMRTSDLGATAKESREATHNTQGDWNFLRPHEGVPEFPVIIREETQVCCCNLRKTRRFSPQGPMRTFSTGAS